MEISELLAPQVLRGRIALVTGAGQGNGKSIAKGLAKAGAQVIVTDLNEENAKTVAAEINAAGEKAVAYKLDVTSRDACMNLALVVATEIGNIDVLVNNAGIIIRENMDSENAASNFERTMKVNVMGTFLPTLAWMDALKETKGAIINVGSIASSTGVPNTVGYSPSKGAVKLMTQALAVELARYGVRVNAIAPGVIETPMTASTRDSPQRLEKFMLRTPMARVGQPEELVGPVVFLASSMATYVTGVTLPVDGGYLAS